LFHGSQYSIDYLQVPDKQASSGRNLDVVCLLRSGGDEGRNHLLFNCPHSKAVWGLVLQPSGINRNTGWWDHESQWAKNFLQKRFFTFRNNQLFKICQILDLFSMMGSFSCQKFLTILGLLMCEMKRNNVTPDVKTYTLSTWCMDFAS